MPNAHLRVQHGWCNSSGSLKGTVIEIVGKNVAHGDVQEEQKKQILNQCALLASISRKFLVKKCFFLKYSQCVYAYFENTYTQKLNTLTSLLQI